MNRCADGVGLASLAVRVPAAVRTNDDIARRQPELLAAAAGGSLAGAFRPVEAVPRAQEGAFDRHRARYAADPFAGGAERRVLDRGESVVDILEAVALDALAAAQTTADACQLVMVASVVPSRVWPGDAIHLADRLGTRAAVVNVESWNSSFLVAVQQACALVAHGQHEQILVACACTNTRLAEPSDTFSWLMGDAACACVVRRGSTVATLSGATFLNTRETRDAFAIEVVSPHDGPPGVRLRPTASTRPALVAPFEEQVRDTVGMALARAGCEIADIDAFALYWPTAWLVDTTAELIGAPPDRCIDLFGRYGNVGPVIPALGLCHAAMTGLAIPGSRVLVFVTGPMGNAGAAVMRWADIPVGLAEFPRGPVAPVP